LCQGAHLIQSSISQLQWIIIQLASLNTSIQKGCWWCWLNQFLQERANAYHQAYLEQSHKLNLFQRKRALKEEEKIGALGQLPLPKDCGPFHVEQLKNFIFFTYDPYATIQSNPFTCPSVFLVQHTCIPMHVPPSFCWKLVTAFQVYIILVSHGHILAYYGTSHSHGRSCIPIPCQSST
jgi:hypothetical protein